MSALPATALAATRAIQIIAISESIFDISSIHFSTNLFAIAPTAIGTRITFATVIIILKNGTSTH